MGGRLCGAPMHGGRYCKLALGHRGDHAYAGAIGTADPGSAPVATRIVDALIDDFGLAPYRRDEMIARVERELGS